MKQPFVIFLNGPTGVGKSSIAKLLQSRLLPAPFLHIGIDMMINMMPEGLNNWHGNAVYEGFWWEVTSDPLGNKLAHIQTGPYATKICESLRDVALTLLNNGHNLIIDEICLLPGSFTEWRKILVPFKTLYVGLSAPLKVLELRETERGDRIAGSARAQYSIVHCGNTYGLNLDTSIVSPEDCADKVVTAIWE